MNITTTKKLIFCWPPKILIFYILKHKTKLVQIFNDKIFSNPKSEELLQKHNRLSSKSSDIILDFFLGSGTTAAVAHKMNRKYIGIEQMDYIQDIGAERLKKVIDGEQGGISKFVNWQGWTFCNVNIRKFSKSCWCFFVGIENKKWHKHKKFLNEWIIFYLKNIEKLIWIFLNSLQK
ncbi:site-specific DNA-methyltransferase [Mycoplasmopsis bovis]|nr:site-specific DNA-methyltransferase [Mycoplasmopsis bovis]